MRFVDDQPESPRPRGEVADRCPLLVGKPVSDELAQATTLAHRERQARHNGRWPARGGLDDVLQHSAGRQVRARPSTTRASNETRSRSQRSRRPDPAAIADARPALRDVGTQPRLPAGSSPGSITSSPTPKCRLDPRLRVIQDLRPWSHRQHGHAGEHSHQRPCRPWLHLATTVTSLTPVASNQQPGIVVGLDETAASHAARRGRSNARLRTGNPVSAVYVFDAPPTPALRSHAVRSAREGHARARATGWIERAVEGTQRHRAPGLWSQRAAPSRSCSRHRARPT